MEQTPEFQRARARAQAKVGFFVHVGIFVGVMVLLVIINLLTSPAQLWFIWPLMGWGLAVAIHGARIFLKADKEAIVDALAVREMVENSQDERSPRPE